MDYQSSSGWVVRLVTRSQQHNKQARIDGQANGEKTPGGAEKRRISEEVLQYLSWKFHFSTFIPQFPPSLSVLVLPFRSVACVMKEAENVVTTVAVAAVGQKMRALMFWVPVHLCVLSSLETPAEIWSFSSESPRNQDTSGSGSQYGCLVHQHWANAEHYAVYCLDCRCFVSVEIHTDSIVRCLLRLFHAHYHILCYYQLVFANNANNVNRCSACFLHFWLECCRHTCDVILSFQSGMHHN